MELVRLRWMGLSAFKSNDIIKRFGNVLRVAGHSPSSQRTFFLPTVEKFGENAGSRRGWIFDEQNLPDPCGLTVKRASFVVLVRLLQLEIYPVDLGDIVAVLA